jgi:TrmH family RNA methyltransferase
MLKKWDKLIRLLHQKKHRYQEGLFLVEGEKNVVELLMAKKASPDSWAVEALFYSAAFASRYGQSGLHKEAAFSEEVSAEALERCGTLQSNQSALAVVAIPVQEQSLPSAGQGWLLALDEIKDPGNLGTIIRIADWYGIKTICCSQNTTDWYSPKTISATMGSFLRVQPLRLNLPLWLAEYPLPRYGAFLEGESIHQSPTLAQGVLVIGSESHGISPEVAAHIDKKLHIPRFGGAESLNAAVATAILCDNMLRLSRI